MTAGLLLAAGAGTRFGMPKALVRFRGGLLVDHAVRALVDGGCSPVVVVVGAAGDAVADHLRHSVDQTTGRPAVRVVANPDWAEGMGSSLRAGLAALAGETAAVVLTVDTPGVTARAVARLAEHSAPEALARATYRGEPGHPVLLGSEHWAGVAELAVGDTGARPYLSGRPVANVPCEDVADGADADRPEDLTDLETP